MCDTLVDIRIAADARTVDIRALVAGIYGHAATIGWIVDPPWNDMSLLDALSLSPSRDQFIAMCDNGSLRAVISRYGSPNWIFAWDCVSSWYTGRNNPLRRMKLALWYGPMNRFDLYRSGTRLRDAESGKTRTVRNSRGSYTYAPKTERVLLSDVYSEPITKLHRHGPSHGKPENWIRGLIGGCLGGTDVIVDCFAGTGVVASVCIVENIPVVSMGIDPNASVFTNWGPAVS